MTDIHSVSQINMEGLKPQSVKKSLKFCSQQIQATDSFEKNLKSEELQQQSKKTKTLIGGLILFVTGMVIAGLAIARNKRIKIPKGNLQGEKFRRWKFNLGGKSKPEQISDKQVPNLSTKSEEAITSVPAQKNIEPEVNFGGKSTSHQISDNQVPNLSTKSEEAITSVPAKKNIEPEVNFGGKSTSHQISDKQVPNLSTKSEEAITSVSAKKTIEPEVASFIKTLRNKPGVTSKTKTYILNDGTRAEFEVLLNSKTGGSNTGYYVINKSTGDLFYAKEAAIGSEQLKAEFLATKLYEAAGINVPQVSLFKCKDGSYGLLSKFVPELQPVYKASSEASEGFGMDVLLANWDVVGLSHDNLLTNGRKIIRIDAGGSFNYRAQGAYKNYGVIPTELITMLDSGINHEAAQMFGKMSRNEMIASLEKVVNLSTDDINKCVAEASCVEYRDLILARQKFIADILTEMKKTQQGSLSTSEYMKQVMQASLKKYILNAKTYEEIENVKNVLKFYDDEQVTSQLQKIITQQESKLKLSQILPPAGKKLSESDSINFLEKVGSYRKDSNGEYVRTLSDVQKHQVHTEYGLYYGKIIIDELQQSLSNSDIKNITEMLNVCDGKYRDLVAKNFDMFILLYQNIKNTGVFLHSTSMSDAQWALIFNILKTRVTKGQLEAFNSYKGSGYAHINDALTSVRQGQKNFSELGEGIREKIGHIESYINTQVLPESVTLYRGESFKVLESVKLPENKNLCDELQKLQERINTNGHNQDIQNKIEELRSEIIQNNYFATQERFMSTSLLPNRAFSGDVKWELQLPKGARGVMLDAVSTNGICKGECEVLLQRNSRIHITDIEYKHGRFYVKGEIKYDWF